MCFAVGYCAGNHRRTRLKLLLRFIVAFGLMFLASISQAKTISLVRSNFGVRSLMSTSRSNMFASSKNIGRIRPYYMTSDAFSTSAAVETVASETDLKVTTPSEKYPKKPSRYPAGRYQFTHTSLPDETMYIFDGTAMLFASYFNAAALKGATKPAGSAVAKEDTSSVVVDAPSTTAVAVLSTELNARIISGMSDEQVAEMIECFKQLDGGSGVDADVTDTCGNGEGAGAVAPAAAAAVSGTDGALVQHITMVDRQNLQLRCEPLVNFLTHFARLVRDIKPKYVAVAFDAGRKTFRNDLYPPYKRQRSAVSVFISFLVRCLSLATWSSFVQTASHSQGVFSSSHLNIIKLKLVTQ